MVEGSGVVFFKEVDVVPFSHSALVTVEMTRKREELCVSGKKG